MEVELLIRRERPPREENPEVLLEYILRMLGYERNLEIYRGILKRLKEQALSSTELSQGIAKRTTTIYHINKLVRGGLIIKRGSKYQLRESSFERLVEDLRRDVERAFEDLLEVARRLEKVWR